MLNQILKFTLFSSILLWLRPRWRGLLALCALVILVHVLHGEYLNYVELSGERAFLVWSYVLKWAVLVSGVVVYLLLTVFSSRNAPSGTEKLAHRKRPPENSGVAEVADDGFDFLRQKGQLESRAEKLISRQKR